MSKDAGHGYIPTVWKMNALPHGLNVGDVVRTEHGFLQVTEGPDPLTAHLKRISKLRAAWLSLARRFKKA